MELFSEFIKAFAHYGQELWLYLAFGFLMSGIVHKFIPSDAINKHLGQAGLKPIFIASVVGVVLPVCCLGSLPIALTLRRKGARLGAVLAFLVATPATSISALIVCWKLLGLAFTLIISISVILMALLLGIICDGIKLEHPSRGGADPACCTTVNGEPEADKEPLEKKIKGALAYGFVVLPREIGLEILVGIAIASFITAFDPLQNWIHEYLVGLAGYAFVLAVGLVTYVCSTASVPVADAFLQSGLSHGQALCYLLVGPITSYGTILVIKKDFGTHVLILYLSVIISMSFLSGILVDLYLLN